jgi:hypothetical protein
MDDDQFTHAKTIMTQNCLGEDSKGKALVRNERVQIMD